MTVRRGPVWWGDNSDARRVELFWGGDNKLQRLWVMEGDGATGSDGEGYAVSDG